ncbi:MAG: HAD family hydrolase [Rhodothalassiaceae bacterium]
MLNALFPQVDWSRVEAVGFDLDGTLYDEYDFIDQVYQRLIEEALPAHAQSRTGRWMRLRWLAKGSSYPHIFTEAAQLAGLSEKEIEPFVARALSIYRTFEPALALPPRVRALLEVAAHQWPIFLVTDGNAALQRRKATALGLDRWIDPARMVFTGALPPGSAKPSAAAFGHLPDISPDRSVFFGDRECDAGFARESGCQFVAVAQMMPRKDG